MSINAYEQMATGVTNITSIALVTLEVRNSELLVTLEIAYLISFP